MSSSLRRQALARGVSGGLPPIPDGQSAPSLPRSHRPPTRDYSLIPWSSYFTEKRMIKVNGTDSFCVYLAGDSGPLFVLLHGGGYSGLTWACFTKELIELVHCRVLAIDQRGHGETVTGNEDLSIDVLAKDVKLTVDAYLSEMADEIPGVILVGHSMGGSVAVHTAEMMEESRLLGLVVIDVVEGSAMDALFSMQSFLRGRPASFESIPQGIEWCVRSGQTRNVEAARVSFPSQLKVLNDGDGASGSHGGDAAASHAEEPAETKSETVVDGTPSSKKSKLPSGYVWRIDLTKTEQYWKGWFAGMSQKFLNIPAPKTLILAGVDRLDKDLTVGQMQGKFQMIVLPKVGHAVQEDSPDKVAEAMATFCVRHQLTAKKKDFKMVFPGC